MRYSEVLGSTCAIIMALYAGSAAQARQADPLADRLPQGEGRQLVIDNCAGACHSADRILNAHKTSAEWRKTVEQMVSNGAQLFPDEVDLISKYLSEHIGGQAPASAAGR